MKNAFLIILFLAFAEVSRADLLDDLSSPSQAVRDNAAATIRTTFHATPESKWNPLVASIKKGQSKTEIRELLRPYNVSTEGGFGGGGAYSESYRLDNEWHLVCWFTDKDNLLVDRRLSQYMKRVWVEPPDHYTGKWIGYFIDGQISDEINYKDGKYFGELRSYRSDGSLCFIQHYSETGINGDDIGYHPSGKIAYKGQYKDGKQVGTWTWFDEQGNIVSTQKHPEE